MTTLLIHVSLSLLIEFIVRRATYTVLDMKSVPLYLALCFTCFCASYTMLRMEFNPVLRTLIISPLANFVVPLVMSRGPVGMRLTRIAFINVAVLLTEIGGSVIYYALSGSPFPGSFADVDPMTIVVIYSLLAFLTTITCEANIAFFRHADSRWDETFEPAALVMMLGTFVFFSMLIIRYDLSGVNSILVPAVTDLCVVLAVTLNYAMLRVARRDAQAKRELALRAVRERRMRHLMREVERVTARSVSMRHLRHDLANQIGVVRALADQGRLEDADRYLAALQELASRIASPGNDEGTDHE